MLVDTVLPTITLQGPAANSTDVDGNITFSFMANDINLANCSLWTNSTGTWVLNATNSTPVATATEYSFNITTLHPATTFLWNIQCIDNAGNAGWNAQNLTVSTLNSIGIELYLPTSTEYFEQNKFFSFSVNVSCTGENCGTVNVTLDPSSGQEDVCIWDSSSGGAITDCTGTGTLCAEGYDCVTTERTSSYFTLDLPATSITNINFSLYYTCSPVTWTFKVNGITVGVEASTGSGCTCTPDSTQWPEVHVITNSSINDIWNFGGQNNLSVTPTGGCNAWYESAINYESEPDKTIISTDSSVTPFWTNASSNPLTINLTENQSEIVTFYVNSTGSIGNSYLFFAYANKTSDTRHSAVTGNVNITIISGPSTNITIIGPQNRTDLSVADERALNFGCMAQTLSDSDPDLVNITFYVWNSANDITIMNTTNVSGSNGTVNFTYTFPSSQDRLDYTWGCSVSDTYGHTFFNSENYTLSLAADLSTDDDGEPRGGSASSRAYPFPDDAISYVLVKENSDIIKVILDKKTGNYLPRETIRFTVYLNVSDEELNKLAVVEYRLINNRNEIIYEESEERKITQRSFTKSIPLSDRSTEINYLSVKFPGSGFDTPSPIRLSEEASVETEYPSGIEGGSLGERTGTLDDLVRSIKDSQFMETFLGQQGGNGIVEDVIRWLKERKIIHRVVEGWSYSGLVGWLEDRDWLENTLKNVMQSSKTQRIAEMVQQNEIISSHLERVAESQNIRNIVSYIQNKRPVQQIIEEVITPTISTASI